MGLSLAVLLSACAQSPVAPAVSQPAVDSRAELFNLPYCQGQDPKHRFDLYRPEQRGGPFPLVISIHGGGWTQGSKQRGADQVSFFAGLVMNGFAVAAINYRLAPQHSFEEMLQDIDCAVSSLISQASRYNLDPQRIGLMGFSAGGHLALMATAQGQSAGQRPVVAFYPATALAIHQELFKKGGPRAAQARMQQAFGTDDPRYLNAISPLHHVASMQAPILLVHGQADQVVDVMQSRRLLERGRQLGKPVQLIEVIRGQHGLRASRRPQPGIRDIALHVVEFYRRHLMTPAPSG